MPGNDHVLKLDTADFDLWLSQTEKAERAFARKTNDRFTAAMARAIKRGKETAKIGTFIDETPPINAVRLRGHIPMSNCGSPAAACMESSTSALK